MENVVEAITRGKKEIEAIRLEAVYIDERSRDGTWCCAPYPNHPKGCPNFGKRNTCPPKAPKYEDIVDPSDILAIIIRFDLLKHEQNMKEKHPHWTRRQCRNPLYWQNSVRSKLKKTSYDYAKFLYALTRIKFIVLEIPEANGVNIFKTMAAHELMLKTDPDIVYKIMIVGKAK